MIHQIDRIFAIDGTSPDAMAMLEERIAALQPRMPWLYLLIAIYYLGLAAVLHAVGWSYFSEVPLGILIVVRMRYWIRHRTYSFRGEAARSSLRGIGLGTVAVAVSYLLMLGIASQSIRGVDLQLLMLSASICSVASAQTISTLNRASLIILILLGLPTALVAVIGPNPVAAMVGFNLILCILISQRMLKIQDATFVRQFQLRLEGEAERNRAERAEKRALIERAQARVAAESDFLTGLPNRRAFLAAIRNRAVGGADDAVMILDLDGFKPVNDTFGHPTGDDLLKQVSKRLCVQRSGGAFVARLGGDEFALLVQGISGEAARDFASKVVADLGRPYRIGSSTIGIAACCGVSTLGSGASDPSVALREADLALYRAKAVGRGSVECYDSGMGEAVRRRSEIEMALRKPGIEQEIELVFQPIFDLDTMGIQSFEALARWSHSTLGPVSPSDFIPITEQIQLVEELSGALLVRAVGHAKDWPARLRLSFNLSAVQLCSLGSAARVLEIIAAENFPPERLQIEVTETAMMADVEAARDNIDVFRAAGVFVVLDDFGAGYASVGYLRDMQFDKLKLDGSLLAACDTMRGTALLKGVIDLARSIGTPCIAEHVETMQQVTLLRIIGCRFAQGFWLGRPLGADAAARLANAPLLPGNLRLAS